MSDLITTSFAAQFPALASLQAGNPTLLQTLVSAASQNVRVYCSRQFTQGSYTQYVSGTGIPYDEVIFPEFPVVSIQRVATCPVAPLLVNNTDNETNQRATVEATETAINLRRWASAVEYDNLGLTYAEYPTIQAMAGAIANCGGGWTAQVQGNYGLFASADLRWPQGEVTAINGGAYLALFTEQVPTWIGASISPDGTVWGFNGSYGWRLDQTSGRMKGYFPPGSLNIRIDYTAGFSTIPMDIQQGTALLAQYMYQTMNQDFTLSSVQLGPFRKVLNDKQWLMPPAVRLLIDRYRDRSKMFWSAKQ